MGLKDPEKAKASGILFHHLYNNILLLFHKELFHVQHVGRKYKPHCLHITSNLCDTLYDLIKEKGKGKFDDRLTQIVVGGSKCRNDIISDFAKYQVTVCSCYGLTECSPVVSLSSSKYYK